MHVDSNATVAGYPVLLVRQALRKLRHIDTWGSGMLEAAAGLPPGAGPELANALAAQCGAYRPGPRPQYNQQPQARSILAVSLIWGRRTMLAV